MLKAQNPLILYLILELQFKGFVLEIGKASFRGDASSTKATRL